MKLHCAYKSIPREGETECGDAVLVQISGDRALLAVIDVLGHGEGASRVASRAIASLQRLPRGVDAPTALDALQRDLRSTRGAAATLWCVRGTQAELIGLGNVSCRALGTSMPFVPRPGIVGTSRGLPKPISIELAVGQRFLVHSDGVSHRFDLRTLSEMSAEEACSFILANHRNPSDDASVLIIDIKPSLEGKR